VSTLSDVIAPYDVENTLLQFLSATNVVQKIFFFEQAEQLPKCPVPFPFTGRRLSSIDKAVVA
jgi:hypothetical protein